MDLLDLVESTTSADIPFQGGERGEKTRARLLLSFALGTGIAGFPLCVVLWLLMDAVVPAGVIALGVVLMFATWPVLRLSERLDVASNWASFVLFITLVAIIPLTGGSRSPGLPWAVLVPVFALVFGGQRSGLFWGLVSAGLVVGIFMIPGRELFLRHRFSEDELRLLTMLATLLLMGLTTTLFLMYRRYSRELSDVAANFEAEASRDPLTGLQNRREFERTLTERLRRARRDRESLAVGIVDLDNFKSINDERGHAAGDNVLVGAAKSLYEALRERDILARVGGDEFAILLDTTEAVDNLEKLGRRLTEACDDSFGIDLGDLEIGCSIGFAIIESDQLRMLGPEEARDRVMEAADRAMYRAKEQSRDWAVERLTPSTSAASAS